MYTPHGCFQISIVLDVLLPTVAVILHLETESVSLCINRMDTSISISAMWLRIGKLHSGSLCARCLLPSALMLNFRM